MNVVATDTGTLVEIQGTGEGRRSALDAGQDARRRAGGVRDAVRRPARGAGAALSGRDCRRRPRRRRRSGRGELAAPATMRSAATRRSGALKQLLVASRNRKKLAELRQVLDGAGITGLELLTLDDVPPYEEAPETGATFEENAVVTSRDGYHRRRHSDARRRLRDRVDALQQGCPGAVGTLGRRARLRQRTSLTTDCCWPSWVMCPTSGAARRSSRCARWSPDPGRSWCAGNGQGDRARTVGGGASGMTRFHSGGRQPQRRPLSRRRRTRPPTADGRLRLVVPALRELAEVGHSLISRVCTCSTMIPRSGMVPASSTPMVLAIGPAHLHSGLAVNSR